MPKYGGKQNFSLGSFPEVGPKHQTEKKKKYSKISFFLFKKKWNYLLVMPKYWGKQIFSNGSFPEVGQKQKTEKREREQKSE